jgi:hypothetical protein
MSSADRPRNVAAVNWLIFLGAVAAAVVVMWIADRVGWIDLSDKSTRGGGSSGAVGMLDEVFAPTRHETRTEFERQARLPREAPTPARDDHDLLSGTVLIRVPSVRGGADGPQRPETRDRSY